MKKLIAVLLFISCPLWAVGPKYSYEDPHLDDEIQNIYKQINSVLNSKTYKSSFTVSGITVDNITINNSQYGASLGKLVQSTSTATASNTSTTGTTLTDATGYVLSITPKSASNKVIVSAYVPVLLLADAANTMVVRIVIDRDGITIFDPVRVFGSGGSLLAENFYGIIPVVFVDSPNATSAVTYKIRFARNADFGTGTIYINDGLGKATMLLQEVVYP